MRRINQAEKAPPDHSQHQSNLSTRLAMTVCSEPTNCMSMHVTCMFNLPEISWLASRGRKREA